MADSAIAPDGAGIYPGTCASGLPDGKTVRGWRLKTEGKALCFTDLVQGNMKQDVARDVGDFIVFRADEGVTYQLAVVVDDAAQGISRIVRGADLLDSTPRQIALQQCLGIPSPEYAHFPVVLDEAGNKLSKQHKARALDAGNPARDLRDAFAFLGLAWADAVYASLDELWQNAIARWSLQLVPGVRAQQWVKAKRVAGTLPQDNTDRG
jgi:glutamyl-Q tRNA(Asp) synthetase